MYVVGLEAEVSRLTSHSVGSSTAKAYRHHAAEYTRFCRQMRVPSIRKGGSKSIELWLASLSRAGFSYPTILSRLSAIRHMAKREGLSTDCNTGKVQLILKGLKNSYVPKTKSPVTISHLKRLYDAASALTGKLETARFRSIISLAFFGFLRPSEVCLSTANHHLRVGDIRFSGDGKACYVLFKSFKHSKDARTIKICDVGGLPVKPVALLRRYMRLLGRSDNAAPLFSMSPRGFRKLLAEMCELACIRTRITPHCFRHGGATWASQQGWSETRIKAHGRWRSNAHSCYIKPY